MKALSEERKTELFVQLFMEALKAATKNAFLQSPKVGSEKWLELEKARKLVDQMDGDMGDFIRCQFRALQHFKTIPQPHHLSSTKAVERYLIHQKMKRSYRREKYSIEGENVTVYATGKVYPIRQLDSSNEQDPDAAWAIHVTANNPKLLPTEEDGAAEALEYLVVKYEYKGRTVPENVIRKLKELSY